MEASGLRQYAFPRINRVQLHAFSLYSLRPNVSVSLNAGVLCIAGANGIGKSTFLATVNYGLTGAVPHPRRRLLSAQAYLKEATDYSAAFFDGRIDESDRENAAVTVEFSLANQTVSVTRGLFDPADVRELKITGTGATPISPELTPLQRDTTYKELVCRLINLTSFEQFVFLQHFIFTFDEARHLLFWDEAATSQTLFLCFGGDPQDAARADHLNREAEKAGSRGRNAQFQVNSTRKRMELLRQSISSSTHLPDNIDDLDRAYRTLSDQLEETVKAAEQADAKLTDAEIKVTQESASLAALRANYNDAFNRFLHGGASPREHPLVARSIRDQECGICQTKGAEVAAKVVLRLKEGACPLCGSPLKGPGTQDEKLREELSTVDQRLAEARDSLEQAVRAQERLKQEAQNAHAKVVSAREAVTAFEAKDQDIADLLKGRQAAREGPIAQALAGLEKAMVEFTATRDAAYADRDRLRDELKALQRGLELRYARAEKEFVPRFRSLAELFLGIDLDVSLEASPPASMKLVVELRGNERRDENQLSESQRFFVDIALRMALAQQMSERSCLFIDTPEGSLDIAYEERVGEMFARFVESGHDIIMTANINSSKLLTTLARRCGSKGMHLNQMTGWTELSDVQQAATHLFQEAYEDIAKALAEGPAE